MCNDDYFLAWRSVSYATLVKSKLDHLPILLTLQNVKNNSLKTFGFLNMWAFHLDCDCIVKKTIVLQCVVLPHVCVSLKIETAKEGPKSLES